jgi:hypothetical protein
MNVSEAPIAKSKSTVRRTVHKSARETFESFSSSESNLIITDEDDGAEDGGDDSDEMSDAQVISRIPAALDLWSPQSRAEIRRIINEGKAFPRRRNLDQRRRKTRRRQNQLTVRIS